MLNNKLNIKYEEKNDIYIILDNIERIIWCLNFNDLIEYNNNIITTKKLKKYNIFLKNISIFGLYPEYNLNEFN